MPFLILRVPSSRLLASAFGGGLRLLHLFRHFSFNRVKVETRAFLHWRIFEKGLEFLAHHLLDENKAPELELEPIEVLLRAFFRPIVWPALALKRIEPQIDQIGHVNVRFFTQPALRLVDETILVVVNTDRANRAFAEVEDLVTVRWAFASDGVHLVVAIQMVLVSPVAEFHTLKQLIGDVQVASGGEKGGEPIQTGEDAVLHRVSRNMAGPAQDARHAKAPFEHCPLGLRERRRSTIGPGEEFGSIIGGEDDDGIVVKTKVLELLHDQTDVIVELGHAGLFFRPAILRVAHLLVFVEKVFDYVDSPRLKPAE